MKPDAGPSAPLDLANLFEMRAERLNRKLLAQRPGLQVVHLTLAPGQGVPAHRHPGCHVLLQDLEGSPTVCITVSTTGQLEEATQEAILLPQQLLYVDGDGLVSLRSAGDAPSALLITLVKREQRRDHEDPALTSRSRVS